MKKGNKHDIIESEYLTYEEWIALNPRFAKKVSKKKWNEDFAPVRIYRKEPKNGNGGVRTITEPTPYIRLDFSAQKRDSKRKHPFEDEYFELLSLQKFARNNYRGFRLSREKRIRLAEIEDRIMNSRSYSSRLANPEEYEDEINGRVEQYKDMFVSSEDAAELRRVRREHDSPSHSAKRLSGISSAYFEKEGADKLFVKAPRGVKIKKRMTREQEDQWNKGFSALSDSTSFDENGKPVLHGNQLDAEAGMTMMGNGGKMTAAQRKKWKSLREHNREIQEDERDKEATKRSRKEEIRHKSVLERFRDKHKMSPSVTKAILKRDYKGDHKPRPKLRSQLATVYYIDGKLKGEKITQEDAAKQFKVSRQSVSSNYARYYDYLTADDRKKLRKPRNVKRKKTTGKKRGRPRKKK